MPTRIIQWLLDLDHIRLGRDAPLSLSWQSPLPLWFLVPAGTLTLILIVLTYRRQNGGALVRTVLASLRLALLAGVVILFCEPVLTLQRDRIEPSHVALLVDVSQSMLIKDADPGPTGPRKSDPAESSLRATPKTRLSRIEGLRRALLADENAALRAMLARNELEIYSFGASASRQALVSDTTQLPIAEAALGHLVCDAPVTNVPNAVSQVLRQTQSGRLAAIVLASDGRTTDQAVSTQSASISQAITAAASQQVPIYAVLIGSPVPRRDLSVELLAAPDHAFLKDNVAIKVRLAGSGLQEPSSVILQLIQETDHVTLDTQRIVLTPERPAAQTPGDAAGNRSDGSNTLGSAAAEVELRFQPRRTGRRQYHIEALPLEGEVETDNNRVRVQIDIIENQLHVLYVDGYPRYEYRYLKNALLREPTIRSSCLLLSADPDFAQEGTDPIRRFPQTIDELNAYDVVLFGDVDPADDWLSPAQQEMLVQYVSHGGGFGLIAGTRHAPAAFIGTELQKLIPVRIDPDFLGTYPHPLETSFHPRLTADGRHSRIFRFSSEPAGATIDFDTLSGLYWIARTLGPKPGTEVLCEHPGMETKDGAMPLMVLGRYGAGHVFFSATDETWRWRSGGKDWIFDSFWLQVCRALMKTRDLGADRRLVIRTDRRRYHLGQRVHIQVEVRRPDIPGLQDEEAQILVRDADNRPWSRVKVSRPGGSSQLFEGSFVPPGPGSFLLECQDLLPTPGRKRPSALVQVTDYNAELEHPQADHEALRRLARATGGKVMRPDEIAAQTGTILDRALRIPDDVSEPLWDSKLVLAIFILMIGSEWVLRKACGNI